MYYGELENSQWVDCCLVPRPHYYAGPKPFGSRGPSVSDTSLKRTDREGLGKRHTGARKGWFGKSSLAS